MKNRVLIVLLISLGAVAIATTPVELLAFEVQ
jgi:hypothetical protein